MSTTTRRTARPATTPQQAAYVPQRRFGWLGVIAGLVAGALVASLVAVAVTHGSDGRTDVQRRADEIRAQDAARNAKQVVELTSTARKTAHQLAPVLTGLAKALPVGLSAPSVPKSDQADVAKWQKLTDDAAKTFANPPSGDTGTNVARGGFRAAVDELDTTVSTFAAAFDAKGQQRSHLFLLAAKERDNAVLTWSVAATQLDAVNVDTGHGHAHVFLPANPNMGAFTPDDAPEGSG